MRRISIELQNKITNLRLTGNSILDIVDALGIAKTTVQRYVLSIKIPESHKKAFRERQGGSRIRALALRDNVHNEAVKILDTLHSRDYFILLLGLYWGEGTKKDFEIINSDPKLIQSFLLGVIDLGIGRERLSVSLRLHSGLSIVKSKEYWSEITGLPFTSINRIEIIEGKKKGKLQYGMCRIRVKKGIRERILIQTCISLIGKESNKRLLSQ
jgi:hypothetical protein